MSYRYIARRAAEGEGPLGTCSSCAASVVLIRVDNFKQIDRTSLAKDDDSLRTVCRECALGERYTWEERPSPTGTPAPDRLDHPPKEKGGTS